MYLRICLTAILLALSVLFTTGGGQITPSTPAIVETARPNAPGPTTAFKESGFLVFQPGSTGPSSQFSCRWLQRIITVTPFVATDTMDVVLDTIELFCDQFEAGP